MNIASSIEYGRKHYADRTAILFEGEQISYRALDEMASRAAAGFLRLGVRPGDRVALFLPNHPCFAVAYFGALKIGAIAVSVNPGLKSDEVSTILNDSDPSVVVTTDSLRHLVGHSANVRRLIVADGNAPTEVSLGELIAAPETRAVDLDPSAPAAILYTSGTTGMPKGATLSHANVVFTMESKRVYLRIRPKDRMLLFLPLFHCFGQNAILNACLHAGATLVLHRAFDAERVLDSIAQDRVTIFCGVPTTFVVLHAAAARNQLASVRCFFSAAASLPAAFENQWLERFGMPIYQGYGLTETSPFASYNHLTHHRAGSIGTPIQGVEMRVVSLDDNCVLPAGEKGEIVVRGPNVMLGYWNRPHETADVIRDGWFHTGDIGRLDADGYLYIEDRLKDMVIVGGFNVYPAEVENVLYQHPAVGEAAVYGVPDPVMGELVRAAVVAKPGASVDAYHLINHCRENLASSKVPAEIEFVDDLPRSRSGKVLKRVLRDEHARRVEAAREIPAKVIDAEELQRKLMISISSKVDVDLADVSIDTPFAEYGFTSVMAVELAKEVETWVGRPVLPTIAWHYSSIAALARHLLTDSQQSESGRPTYSAVEVSQLSEEEAEAMLLQELSELTNS